MKNIKKIIISISLPLIAGFLGSFFTAGSVDTWYQAINKPSFNPPSWVFGPVWTILFIMIGLSFFLVWQKNFSPAKKTALAIYFAQLFFNLTWSLFFFGLQSPFLAFVNIIVLWLLILANIIVFYKIDKKAGYLLIPYLLWVSFASILNYSILTLN